MPPATIICSDTSLPGTATIEACCTGYADGLTKVGAAGAVLPLPATAEGNATAVSETQNAHLPQNPTVVQGIYLTRIER